jgi:hypothetical protein
MKSRKSPTEMAFTPRLGERPRRRRAKNDNSVLIAAGEATKRSDRSPV